ncbi:MAG: GldG family protein [Gammaproteobacteria bacterium]
MKISRHRHQQLRIKNRLLTLAILCLFAAIAWLSIRYPVRLDMTSNTENTLSQASKKLLATLNDPVNVTAYFKKGLPIRFQIAHLIDRYSRHKTDMALTFVDPDEQPGKARELNIGAEGLVTVEYQGRLEKLRFIDESSLTNALLQLSKANEKWVKFFVGHGERSPDGMANFDLGRFGKELDRRKINARTLNPAKVSSIPDNSALLVIAAPTVTLLPAEFDMIKTYLEHGGNLLLLADPDNKVLDPVLSYLGLRRLPGTIVDANTQLYKINDPTFLVASEYIQHPITRDFQLITLYPAVSGFEQGEETEFLKIPLLNSSASSWTETGPITGKIRYDKESEERQGPVTFAYALTRDINSDTEQRIVVIGDSDFLANTYLGNVGNLDMGLRMINWLVHDDRFIAIPAKTTPDKQLHLTQFSVTVIGFGFLIVLPLLFLGTGILIWRKRKRR